MFMLAFTISFQLTRNQLCSLRNGNRVLGARKVSQSEDYSKRVLLWRLSFIYSCLGFSEYFSSKSSTVNLYASKFFWSMGLETSARSAARSSSKKPRTLFESLERHGSVTISTGSLKPPAAPTVLVQMTIRFFTGESP